jgi:5'-3' exoribonuclease 2
MTDIDSPIIDFYPEKFVIDLNGKKSAWQGVVLLPFIDEKRLIDAMKERNCFLVDDDHKLNMEGQDFIFVGSQNELYKVMNGLLNQNVTEPIVIDVTVGKAVFGSLLPCKPATYVPNANIESPISKWRPILGNSSAWYFFSKI